MNWHLKLKRRCAGGWASAPVAWKIQASGSLGSVGIEKHWQELGIIEQSLICGVPGEWDTRSQPRCSYCIWPRDGEEGNSRLGYLNTFRNESFNEAWVCGEAVTVLDQLLGWRPEPFIRGWLTRHHFESPLFHFSLFYSFVVAVVPWLEHLGSWHSHPIFPNITLARFVIDFICCVVVSNHGQCALITDWVRTMINHD